MQTRLQRAAICFAILGAVTPLLGQATGPSIPQRGIVPTGSYSLSDIETIDQVYGNVTINIPLTALPAARANSSAPISLVYNSAIYARNGDSTLVNSHFIDPTDSGGWRYSFNYELTDDYAVSDICDGLGNPGPAARRFRLITPDGASHVLYNNSSTLARPSSAAWAGYYVEHPTLCGDTSTSPQPGTFDFYTADGSYIRLHVTIGSGSTWSSNMPWTAYLPNGQVVTGQGFAGSSRIADRNGNGYNISPSTSAAGFPQYQPVDDLGRIIDIQSTLGGNGSELDTMSQTLADGSKGTILPATLQWSIQYVGVEVPNEPAHQYACDLPGGYCQTTLIQNMVQSITLPTQLESLQYTFAYSTQSSAPVQWGQLSTMTLPSGASVNYTYNPVPEAPPYSIFPIASKMLTWEDDTTHTETSMYSCGDTQSSFANPDGGTENHTFTSIANGAINYGGDGLVTYIQLPSGDTVSRTWAFNTPYEASLFPAPFDPNPLAAQETSTISGTSVLTKTFTYDRNGNITNLAETDAIGGASRTTATSYLNGAGTANLSNGAATDDAKGYWNPQTPQILNLVSNRTISGVGSNVTYQYDQGVLSLGNVTQVTSHDSATGSNEVVTNTYDSYGSHANLCQYGYSGTYGNLTLTTNAAGHTTLLCYDANSDRMIERIEVVDSSTDARTFKYAYDTTRLVLTTDFDHSVVHNYLWDAFGRKLSDDLLGRGIEVHLSKTAYNDPARIVTVTSDLNAPNAFNSSHDQALSQSTQYDQLWRPWKTTDAASNITETHHETPAPGATGYGFSYDLVSNPYPNSGSTTGWTRTQRDTGGRAVGVAHFTGALRPTPWASTDPTSTGSGGTSYSGNCTTTSDEAGVSKTSCVDGFGRPRTVAEPAIGANTAYGYDNLNNLTSVSVTASTPGVSATNYAGRSFNYSSLSRLITAANPESEQINYSYWPGGNLKTRTDSRNIVTSYAYNAIDQVTSKSYNDGATPSVAYIYNKSWLLSVQSGSTSYSYTNFDPIGRVTNATQTTTTTSAQSYPFQVSYQPSVGIRSITYPISNRVVTTTYDFGGRPYALTGQIGSSSPTNYVTSTTYQPHGALQAQTLANGNLNLTRSDNPRLQPTSLIASSAGTPLLSLGYSYSAAANNGNVLQQVIARQGSGAGTWTQNFGYTEPSSLSLNRLTTASEVGGWTYNYGFDAVGNRWVSYPTTGLTLETPVAQSWYISSLGQTTNRITTWGYDPAGNVTSVYAMPRGFTYDAENRIATATVGSQTAIYGYDGDGHRVTKMLCPSGVTTCTASTAGATVTTYVYDPAGNLAQEYGTSASSGTEYLVPDALGSTRLVTDGSGNPLRCYDYLPFGEEIAAGTNGRPTGCYGAAVSPPSSPDLENQKFTGKERDAETGLDFFGARYFSGPQGRWTSPDPINLTRARLENPSDTLNKYVYAANNPLKYIDKDGEDITIFYRPPTMSPFDFGHILIGALNQNTGEAGFLDYYPRGGGGAGDFNLGNMQERSATRDQFLTLTIQTSPEQAQKVLDLITKLTSGSPPDYAALSNNCTTVCEAVLHDLGLDFGNVLPHDYWANVYRTSAPAVQQNPFKASPCRTRRVWSTGIHATSEWISRSSCSSFIRINGTSNMEKSLRKLA